jgi:8-oxo-dGTP pyrophosphatase MutT (NUDIX family)
MTSFRVDEADLRRAVLAPAAGARGDDDLNPGLARSAAALRPAAVLCPVARRPSGLTVILTLRPATMRQHAGQVAFPGGKIDPTDPSPLATALRESREEIGLMPDQVEVLGPIDRYETRTGFAITPFVGLVDAAFRPEPEAGEVEAVFEAPLSFLMDPANHRRMSREWQGATRWFWAMPWGDWFIWGATAGMLKCLADRVEAARAAPATLGA